MKARLGLTITATIALSGCGTQNPYADQGLDPRPPGTSMTTIDDSAKQAAITYAITARTWTPETLRLQWRQQLTLAGGELRHALLDVGAPHAAELAANRREGARVTAELVDARAAGLASATAATFTVVLRERSIERGAMAENQTTNRVVLERRDARWVATAFTIEQTGAGAEF